MTTVRRLRRQAASAPAPQEPEGVSIADRRRAVRTARAAAAAVPTDTMIVRLPGDLDPFTQALERAPGHIQPTRPGEYLHVSDLLSKCVRRRALNAMLGVQAPSKRLTLSDLMTFAQGDAIHDVLKDRARQGGPQQVWGKWSCKCKALYHEEPCTYGEIDQDEVCPHCESRVEYYHEVSMRDEEHWIVGNPDMLQYLANLDAFHITELKSIAASQFEELVRPKPEHVLQVLFYWWLMRRLGYRLTNRCTIFYASKGWMFGSKQPYKSFLIDVEHQLHRLDDMIEDARAHKASILAVRQGSVPALPARTVCSSPSSKDAKSCEVCDTCFEV